MQIKNLAVLILIFLTIPPVYSQETKATISGIVLNIDGQPVEAASVTLKGTGISTLTNEKGEYELKATLGKYVLVITNVGYKTNRISINLTPDGKKVESTRLEEDMAALNEVSINGKSKVQRVREQAFNITAVDLKMVHNSSQDLNQVLNRTTGIRVRESGGMGSDFKFSLNGFSGNQVKFFMDGIPIDNYGSSFTLNNIPVNLAERIEVYKGVVPVELGSDALGGAINIITNQSVKRYVDASYSFGSFDTHKLAINTRFSGKKGFVANINAFGNYSDNSYKVDVSVADKNGNFGPIQPYKHFHDGYKSGGIIGEIGVKGKKYADYLVLGLMASANKKEIQTGSTMQRVVGDAFKDSEAFVSSLKYKKDSLFTKNLSVNLVASYSIVNSRSVDTSSYRYKWDGSRTFDILNNSGEINREKTIYAYDDNSFQANTNFKYDLNDKQYFAFNYSVNALKRKEEEQYRTVEVKPGSPTLDKNILGLSYNLAAFDRKLSFIAFGKKYFLKSRMIDVVDEYAKERQYIVLNDSFDNWGYGTALAYFLTSEIQLKASYEHAFRLPNAEEMLGDGLTIYPAIGLDPEESDNFNAGFSFKKSYRIHSFGFQGNFIYRNAKNFIQNVPEGALSIYKNLADVRVTGFDGSFHYGYKSWLTFEINATQQKSIDQSDFDPPGTNIRNDYKGSQIANVPIFYGNANLGFSFRKIRTSDDNLSVNLLANYVGEYYLKSTKNGAPSTRRTIPEQFTQSIATAYVFGKGKYNVGLECNNITNTKVYDYFMVQKPGRSFTVKFRYFIN